MGQAGRPQGPQLPDNNLDFYRTIVEKATDCIFVRRPTAPGDLVYVNEAFCRHLGYERSELLALSIMDVDVGRTRQQVEDLSALALRGPVVFVTRHRRRDGSLVPVEAILWGMWPICPTANAARFRKPCAPNSSKCWSSGHR